MTNVLFVCSQNRLRSPTAERIFAGRPGIEVRSVGTERDAETVISRDDVEWSDIIFVMEKRHRNRIQSMFKDLVQRKRIICLHIPDDFEFMDSGLILLLEQRVMPYLGPIINTRIGIEGASS